MKAVMTAIGIVGVVLIGGRAGLGAQDWLSAAKDLYASAAYEDALTTLSRLGGATTPDVARQVDEYRAFCLYALGRTREAESIAESIIRKEPLARLEAVDASPRLESMFAGVRKRLLPSLIRDRYRVARSALDRKDFASAEPLLAEARLMISEAEKIGVRDDGLSDLGILVDGFLQLIRSAAGPRTPSPVAAASVATAAPLAAPGPGAASPAITPAPPSSAAPAQADLREPRVYSVADENVTPPVTIEQRMPATTPEMQMILKATKTSGRLDIVIDETGRVVNATMRQSLTSSFDTLMARAASQWKYRPATKDGVAVRYLKTLVLIP
jgi:hypothetical protein